MNWKEIVLGIMLLLNAIFIVVETMMLEHDEQRSKTFGGPTPGAEMAARRKSGKSAQTILQRALIVNGIAMVVITVAMAKLITL